MVVVHIPTFRPSRYNLQKQLVDGLSKIRCHPRGRKIHPPTVRPLRGLEDPKLTKEPCDNRCEGGGEDQSRYSSKGAFRD